MELYIKAAPDGKSVGDCPFAHFVRAVLETKGLEYQVHPCCKETKPNWLLDDHQGKMPCLRNGESVITESSVIVDYLENTFSDKKIRCVNDKQALEATSGLFPALAKFIKKATYDEELKANLTTELKKLDSYLNNCTGSFLCGDQPTLADLSLAPKLYHLKTTLSEFYPQLVTEMIPERVSAYIIKALSIPAVSKTSYPREVVLAGWNSARQ